MFFKNTHTIQKSINKLKTTKYLPSFTLIEVMVSIILFTIIIIFLYQVLDMTQKSNKFYTKKLKEQIEKTHLASIFFKDILHSSQLIQSKGKIIKDIGEDSNKNNFLWLNTKNHYHNPFYNYVFYFISNKNNLIRIESLKKFNKATSSDSFFENAYADIIINNVTKFRVAKHKKSTKIAIYLQLGGKEDYIFSYAPIRSVKKIIKKPENNSSNEYKPNSEPNY
jgi:hypothetical protein